MESECAVGECHLVAGLDCVDRRAWRAKGFGVGSAGQQGLSTYRESPGQLCPGHRVTRPPETVDPTTVLLESSSLPYMIYKSRARQPLWLDRWSSFSIPGSLIND